MALVDRGDRAIAFIANAISGTVSRLDFAVSPTGLSLLSAKTIASGYLHQPDPAALFDAPTGLVYNHRSGVLYVASTLDNAIFAVRDAADRRQDAGPGEIVYQDNVHLHGALAMAMAPNGHLLVSNNDVINADPNQPS
jgi:DNA-binding beta-propeller fold protein YncE